jgi:hypothetical protein
MSEFLNSGISPKTVFLFTCIPARLFLAGLGRYLTGLSLRVFGALLLIPALGFLGLYFGNMRMTAPEAGGKTWWAPLRLLHGLLYLCAAIYGIQGSRLVWLPLLLDWFIAIGLIFVRDFILPEIK